MNSDPFEFTNIHSPVLREQVLDFLVRDRDFDPASQSLCFADATLGLGGHSEALLSSHEQLKLTAIDRDPQALELAKKRLARFEPRVTFQRSAFAEANLEPNSLTGIVADLGLSSLQLDSPERGFAFRFESHLDMRMGPDCPRSAAELVNELSAHELADLFFQFGEEPRSKKIAAGVVQARQLGPITTTTELAKILRRHAGRQRPRRKHKGPFAKPSIDPATRCFQALRIAVNDELGQLSRALPKFLNALEDQGRVAMISFHSLEDRLVKTMFRRWQNQGLGQSLNKRPICPGSLEIQRNRRSRSAKLRVFERQLTSQ